MSFDPKKNWLSVQSYKHDGHLHRMWTKNYLLVDNESFLIVASKKTKVIEDNGRCWWTQEPSVTFYSKKEWWNTIAMIKKDGISFYTNITSPSLIDRGIIKYIDYDLDVKKFADGSLRLLDENEYRRHVERYGYSDDLIKVLLDQTKRILEKMKKGDYPFNLETVNKYYGLFIAETSNIH